MTMASSRPPRRALWLALAPALLAAAGGCGTVARARAAQSPGSAMPGERTPTAAELGLPAKGPVALAALVRTAVRVHPSVVGARRAAEAAAARIYEAEAARYPQVGVNATQSVHDGTSKSSGGGSKSQRFESLGFDVSWLVFDFGQTAALARQAALAWLAAQQDVRTAEVAVALGVRTAYFELGKQVDLLATDREAVRQFQEHLDQVKEFVRVGTRIPYDQTKAEVDLGNARLAEVQAKDGVLSAQATLANAVGLAEVLDWVPAPDVAPLPVPGDFPAAWAAARARDPVLSAAIARERAASALVDARIAALYPGVSVGLSYSKSGSSIPLPWSLDIGPKVQWTPFDGFQNLSTIDESVASLRESRASRAQAEQQAWLNVRTAWLALEDARERLALTSLTLQSAEESLTLAQGRYDAGLATSVDLTDARVALIQAKTARIQARADLGIAAARLAKALGVSVREP